MTLTYSILRFANFAHGEFITFGAYATLTLAGALGSLVSGSTDGLGPLSIGWGVLVAGAVAMVLTAGLALALDALLFGRLRQKGAAITAVMASFRRLDGAAGPDRIRLRPAPPTFPATCKSRRRSASACA